MLSELCGYTQRDNEVTNMASFACVCVLGCRLATEGGHARKKERRRKGQFQETKYSGKDINKKFNWGGCGY